MLLAELTAPLRKRPPVLAERLGQGPDNALLLRHLAASLVIWGHSHALAVNPSGRGDLLAQLLPGFHAGSIGVCLFFALSGCLVSRSWLLHPGLLRFVRARVLRIYPAYVVCLLLTLAWIGPAFTGLTLADYFRHPETLAYLRRNIDLAGLAYTLPGTFASNPVPGVVNGSLWSLALEVRLYLVIAVVGVLGILGRFRLYTGIVLAYAALSFGMGTGVAVDSQGKAALSLLFLAASLACVHARRLPVSTRVLSSMLLGVAAVAHSRWFVPATMLTAGYFAIWFCWRVPALSLPWRGDYSYGLFLYGYPVQQMIVSLLPDNSAEMLTLLALPLTLLIAIASWHALEHPLLRLKQSPDPRKAQTA